MKKQSRWLLVVSLLWGVFVGCEANTIDEVELSADGVQFEEVDTSSSPQILLKAPDQEEQVMMGMSETEVPHSFVELYEEARGTLSVITEHLNKVEGEVTLYQGLADTGETTLGLHFLPGWSIQSSSSVAAFIATRRLEEVTSDDLENSSITEAVGFLSGDLIPSSLQGIQSQIPEDIRSVLLVCQDDEQKIICGGSNLETGLGEVEDEFVHVSHGAPRGGYRMYREPETYNWVFETTDNYSGSNGPQLFFYISEEAFDPSIKVQSELYVGDHNSVVLHDEPIIDNEGKMSFEVQNSAVARLSDYHTITLWCDAANTIFYVAEVRSR